MGWGSGGTLMGSIIRDAMKQMPNVYQRRTMYKILIPAFEWHDCDTLDECRGIDTVFDDVLAVHYKGNEDELE